MGGLDSACVKFFYENQKRLFSERVAENIAEAGEFLEDCMAEVFDSREELEAYMKEEGVDTSDCGDVTEALEVFALPDGRYLYVEA
ncbi:MAG: glyoxalase [Butyrivibrio sp.]|nr:glyoxalase [Butyrivibrio sp.]